MEKSTRDKLDSMLQDHDKLYDELASIDISNDQQKYIELSKKYAKNDEIVNKFKEYLSIESDITELMNIMNEDASLSSIALEEVIVLEQRKKLMDEMLEIMVGTYKVKHKDESSSDKRNAFLEIRAGTGGNEASIFVGDLFRMYTRYIINKGWSIEIISSTPSEQGGYKEIISFVSGKSSYQQLRLESGVHRVQRVPKTETQGRLHTSTCTVAVLPEIDEIEDIDINQEDMRIDTFRSSGAGGQHVNKTDSAIRITHIPTGIVVECQEERSQHKNRSKAMSLLKSRILAQEQSKQKQQADDARRNMVGNAERSEKIRTYNFPQNRLTDHRINMTMYSLEEIMDGMERYIDQIIIALKNDELEKEAITTT